jgi:Tfp pilus assembly protein PilX
MLSFGHPLARRDGGTLRLFLLLLLVLPLLGLCAAAGLEVRSHISTEQAATHAQVAVRAVAEMDAVRAGIQREIVPTIALAVMRKPSLLERTPTAADIQEATDAVVGLSGCKPAPTRRWRPLGAVTRIAQTSTPSPATLRRSDR